MKRHGAGAALALGCVSFLLVTAGSARVLNQAIQSGTPRPKVLEGPETYAAYDRASDLLRQGDAFAAGQILDQTHPETLIIEAGATGEGALTDRSSMTLLIELVKATGNQAVRAAQAGNAAEARVWLRRGWEIGDRVIATPRPGIEALTLAHFADCHLSQVQAQVARLCGSSEAEQTALVHNTQLMEVWQFLISPAIRQAQNRLAWTDTDKLAQMRSLCDRYSAYRTQVGVGANQA